MNNALLKNLEFIQITCSVEFTLDSSSLASLSGEASSTLVEKPLQIRPIIKNKPNFLQNRNNANSLYTKDYRNISPSGEVKTNPIQTQTKPILAQKQGSIIKTNPIMSSIGAYFAFLSGIKPNSKLVLEFIPEFYPLAFLPGNGCLLAFLSGTQNQEMLSPYLTDIYSLRRKVLTTGDYTLFHLLQNL